MRKRRSVSFYAILAFILVSKGLFSQCPITVSGPTAACAGFTVTLTASGATSYTWTSGSFTAPLVSATVAVGPGTYQVKGSTSICMDSIVVTVGTSPPLNLTLSMSSNTSCIASNFPLFSKVVTFTATGASSYVWFPYNSPYISLSTGPVTSVRAPASGCYTVIGSTSVCSASAVACINVYPQFTISVTPSQTSICAYSTVTLAVNSISWWAVGPSSAFSYSWTEPAGHMTLNSNLSYSVIVTPVTSLNYTVQVLDNLNCVSVPQVIAVNVHTCATGLGSVYEDDVLQVYPNPFDDVLNMNISANSQVELLDVFGIVVLRSEAVTSRSILVTGGIASGVYFLRITDGSNRTQVRKLIKD